MPLTSHVLKLVFALGQERVAALEALRCIHDAGVLHGDPTFDNLMVQRWRVRPICSGYHRKLGDDHICSMLCPL